MSEEQVIAEEVVANTRAWVEKAVIGLNLCPFAKQVQVKGQVRYVVSQATKVEDLLYELANELNRLVDTPADETDTTLLIHPQVLTELLIRERRVAHAHGLPGPHKPQRPRRRIQLGHQFTIRQERGHGLPACEPLTDSGRQGRHDPIVRGANGYCSTPGQLGGLLFEHRLLACDTGLR